MHKSTSFSLGLLCTCALVISGCQPAAPSKSRVYIKTLPDKQYQLMVNDKPYIIKGVCYNPVPIGKNHEYDWWSDPAKPWLVDGKLMKEMGVNTVRLYQTGANTEDVRAVIRDLYAKFGIRVMLGHWLGFWEYPCPLYGDENFRKRIRAEVLEMVGRYKDEPGVLCWILGNENNYSFSGQVNPWSTPEIDVETDPVTQRKMRARIYYSFVNELARDIKQIDRAHPVALGNGELIGLEVANEVCPDIDAVACIIYRGKTFGNLFNSLRATFDRPIIISEFGADAYDALKQQEDQNMQAFFLESQWRQIYQNLASNGVTPGHIGVAGAPLSGAGNCLGGTMFEWTDEYWKHNEYDLEGAVRHDIESNWSNGSYYFDITAPRNMNMNEEWFGIVALAHEPGQGLDKRIPRKAYYVVREFWKNPVTTATNNRKGKSR